MKPDANWPTHLINFNVSLLMDPLLLFVPLITHKRRSRGVAVTASGGHRQS